MCKCDISKCKASCCYNVPMKPALFRVYKAHIQRPVLRYSDDGLTDENGDKLVLPITSEKFNENKCPFLKNNFKCAIYDKRPRICRIFGDPPKGSTSKFLRCGWLDGKERDNSNENEQDIINGLADVLQLCLRHKI